MQFMSERPDFEEGDDDATKKAKMKAWLEGVRDDLRPQVNALSEACSEQARQLAADMGEAPTDTNRIYWGTMGNLLVFDGANSTPDRPSFMRCTISPAACRGARLGFYTLNDEPARCKRASATHSGNPLAFRHRAGLEADAFRSRCPLADNLGQRTRVGWDLALEQHSAVLVDNAHRRLLLGHVQSNVMLHHACSPAD
jgi:hypothetical protein